MYVSLLLQFSLWKGHVRESTITVFTLERSCTYGESVFGQIQ